MRRVKTTAIAACTVTFTLVATPALAAPYPVPNAKTELLAAIDATNAAASYQYLDNSLGWTAAFTLAGQYQQVTVGEQRVFNGVGNYHRIDWPSAAVEEKVTGPDYLDNLALQWELTDAASPYALDYFRQWIDIRTERLGRIDSLANANFITVADKSTSGTDTVYRVGDGDYFEYVYTVDAGGRITRLELTRGNRIPETGKYETWAYVPVTVTEPAADTALPIATVRRAIQAATLNATIRSLARDSAKTGNRLRQTAEPFDMHEAPESGEPADIAGLLGGAPVAVDELIRQSGESPAAVQLALLELELGGRLVRHAGGRVSLAG